LKTLPKSAWAWALYDFANTGYAMVVLALIFPRLYKTFWAADLSVSEQTTYFNITVAVASILVAVLAPFLGSLAEMGGLRKRLLFAFAGLGILSALGIGLIGEDLFWLASSVYILGTVSFYCSNIFFDSMLSTVSSKDNRNFISGLGFGLAYTAGLSLILISVLWLGTVDPEDEGAIITISRWHFVLAGCWWAAFSIPLLFTFREQRKEITGSWIDLVRSSFIAMWRTFLEIVKVKHIFWFLLAYLFYIDGVNSIILTATSYGTTIGFTQKEINIGFICVQVVGIPCAIVFGLLADKLGARKMILTAIVLYAGIAVYGAFVTNEPIRVWGVAIPEMYVLASLIGVVQGSIQALSRAYFTSIIPEDKAVAYFGFYSMIGKSAAILGPLLAGMVTWAFNNPEYPVWSTRLGFGSLSILFVLGGICFLKSRKLEA